MSLDNRRSTVHIKKIEKSESVEINTQCMDRNNGLDGIAERKDGTYCAIRILGYDQFGLPLTQIRLEYLLTFLAGVRRMRLKNPNNGGHLYAACDLHIDAIRALEAANIPYTIEPLRS